jgi:C1A family cysteine protease
MDTAFEYTAKNGIESEEDYPYAGRDQKCRYDPAKAIKVNSGFYDVKENCTESLKTALVAGPVAVAIQADQAVFQFYKAGVITGLCGADLNHGVLAVGYDKIVGVEGFIVKNSWGGSWGNKGYVYIGTDNKPNSGQGVCGILAAASQPTSH